MLRKQQLSLYRLRSRRFLIIYFPKTLTILITTTGKKLLLSLIFIKMCFGLTILFHEAKFCFQIIHPNPFSTKAQIGTFLVCTQTSRYVLLICRIAHLLLFMMKIKVEFLGGLDVISNHVREHKLSLPLEEGQATMKDVISHVVSSVIADPKDIPVFLEEGTVRPGILVLINDTDWELEGMEDYVVESGDVFTFTSTLHGG